MITSCPSALAWSATVAKMSSASQPASSTTVTCERVEHLAHQAHLLAKDVGRRRRGWPCRAGWLVAERRLRPVERDHHAVGLVVLQQVDEHRREAEHRVGDLTRRPWPCRWAGRRRRGRSASCRRASSSFIGDGRSVPASTRSATSRIRDRSLIAGALDEGERFALLHPGLVDQQALCPIDDLARSPTARPARRPRR